MRDYINNLPYDTIVLVAVKDSGEKCSSVANAALKSIGAQAPLQPKGFRTPWCLIGYKGGSKSWIRQDYKDNSDEGPAKASVAIPLALSGKTIYIQD